MANRSDQEVKDVQTNKILFQKPCKNYHFFFKTHFYFNFRAADLLVGTAVENRQRGADLCDGKYKPVGSLTGGSAVVKDLEKTHPTPIDCIKILVTASQIEWVIINTVSIWTVTQFLQYFSFTKIIKKYISKMFLFCMFLQQKFQSSDLVKL